MVVEDKIDYSTTLAPPHNGANINSQQQTIVIPTINYAKPFQDVSKIEVFNVGINLIS